MIIIVSLMEESVERCGSNEECKTRDSSHKVRLLMCILCEEHQLSRKAGREKETFNVIGRETGKHNSLVDE